MYMIFKLKYLILPHNVATPKMYDNAGYKHHLMRSCPIMSDVWG